MDTQQQKANDSDPINKTADLVELSQLYLFAELYKFFRESTGLAITLSYVSLILCSLTYLIIFFGGFDINIVKYVSFEDMLAAPIKNPDIIGAFGGIFFVLYFADLGNRFRARLLLKYKGSRLPIGYRVLIFFFWAPVKRQANLTVTVWICLICLGGYVASFARLEYEDIKSGRGDDIEIVFADESPTKQAVLLGTTINYIFVYHRKSETTSVYYLEAIKEIKNLGVNKTANDSPAE